jgi:hypothetical protein
MCAFMIKILLKLKIGNCLISDKVFLSFDLRKFLAYSVAVTSQF